MMILFRADGNANIGMGHIMRCLSIADAAAEQGTECLFVTADETVTGQIRERGYRCEALGTDYKAMDTELPRMEVLLLHEQPTCVVVDSYYVTSNYLQQLKKYAEIAYIDDTASFAYPVDVLLNYNIYGEDVDYESLYRKAGQLLPKMLLGPTFAPLRKEFRDMQGRVIKKCAADVFVSTGGSDPRHIAFGLAKEIEKRQISDMRFHFVLGALNQDMMAIGHIAEQCGSIVVHHGVKRMSELMRSCDLAISAAGSTLYELCATQTPTVTYILADNQQPGAEGFARRGILRCAGDWRELRDGLFEKLLNTAEELANDYAERKRIAETMGSVVDGNGAARVIASLSEW